MGLSKQRNLYQSCPTFLCFESPTAKLASQHNLFRTICPARAKGLFEVVFNSNSLTTLRLVGYIVSLLLLSGLAVLNILHPVEAKTKIQSLRSILNHFTDTRNVYVDPVVKQRARNYIVNMFKDHGLHTWTEEFPSNQEKVNIGYFCSPNLEHKLQIYRNSK